MNEKKELFDSSVTENYLNQLAADIEGYSGADIAALYSETVMTAIRKQLHIDDKGRATMLKSVDEVVITTEDFELSKNVVKTTQQRNKETEEQLQLLKETK